jgi:hypothetical protein
MEGLKIEQAGNPIAGTVTLIISSNTVAALLVNSTFL